ncbi:hypothetical protein [Stutzerimonas nitrititolerans]|uniref:hypothetical protein n=1 Tax=Stutzerimonas nitrititolerans TaxID=2482751 RepID=UPI0015E3FCFC|nr:hypothetical protein [Stutzerimonas nitrititolerans]MBA1186488.1 hypothetical protein [Stutzerimonas stutzeri]
MGQRVERPQQGFGRGDDERGHVTGVIGEAETGLGEAPPYCDLIQLLIDLGRIFLIRKSFSDIP